MINYVPTMGMADVIQINQTECNLSVNYDDGYQSVSIISTVVSRFNSDNNRPLNYPNDIIIFNDEPSPSSHSSDAILVHTIQSIYK